MHQEIFYIGRNHYYGPYKNAVISSQVHQIVYKTEVLDIYHVIRIMEKVIRRPVLALFFLFYYGLPRSLHWSVRETCSSCENFELKCHHCDVVAVDVSIILYNTKTASGRKQVFCNV